MKNNKYIKQIYEEGLATTFYIKPLNFLRKKVKNTRLLVFLEFIIKIIYTLLLILLAIIVFIKLL